MDKDVAETAFVLQGLIYCCILSRIGMEKQQINDFCKNNKILS